MTRCGVQTCISVAGTNPPSSSYLLLTSGSIASMEIGMDHFITVIAGDGLGLREFDLGMGGWGCSGSGGSFLASIFIDGSVVANATLYHPGTESEVVFSLPLKVRFFRIMSERGYAPATHECHG